VLPESLLDGECERLTRRAIELALNGDLQALKMCLERILPPALERPCSFKLLPISTAAEAAAEILASEGAALSATISAYVKVFEAAEIEARISALEAREKIAEAA
jgi:hypothetical protein